MNVPNRYKGFSQLPENVQQRMDPSLAKKYQMGGSVMQRPLFRQMGGPTDMMPQDMMPPPPMGGAPMAPPPMPPPPMAPPPMDPAMAEQMMAAENMGQSAGEDVANAMMTQIDGAQDYESLIDGIRGNELPLDARYQELAGLVGEADAMATPESVLALTQPTIMMTEQGAMDSGIGELMQGISGDVDMEGPMDEGVGSLMAAGAGNTPPVNFRHGGSVAVRGFSNGTPAAGNSSVIAQAQADAPAYQAYFASAMDSEARAADLEEQKRMSQSQMLFDIAGTALNFAGNTEGNTVAERLANAASQTQLTDKIGARSAGILDAKRAQAAEDRQLRMAGLTASLTQAQKDEEARRAEVLAGLKRTPTTKDNQPLYEVDANGALTGRATNYNLNDPTSEALYDAALNTGNFRTEKAAETLLSALEKEIIPQELKQVQVKTAFEVDGINYSAGELANLTTRQMQNNPNKFIVFNPDLKTQPIFKKGEPPRDIIQGLPDSLSNLQKFLDLGWSTSPIDVETEAAKEILTFKSTLTSARDQKLNQYAVNLANLDGQLKKRILALKDEDDKTSIELRAQLRDESSKVTAALNVANQLKVAGVKNGYEIANTTKEYDRTVAIVKLKAALADVSRQDQNVFKAAESLLARVATEDNQLSQQEWKNIQNELNRDFKGTEAEKKAAAKLLQDIATNAMTAEGIDLQEARDLVNQAKSEAKTALDRERFELEKAEKPLMAAKGTAATLLYLSNQTALDAYANGSMSPSDANAMSATIEWWNSQGSEKFSPYANDGQGGYIKQKNIVPAAALQALAARKKKLGPNSGPDLTSPTIQFTQLGAPGSAAAYRFKTNERGETVIDLKSFEGDPTLIIRDGVDLTKSIGFGSGVNRFFAGVAEFAKDISFGLIGNDTTKRAQVTRAGDSQLKALGLTTFKVLREDVDGRLFKLDMDKIEEEVKGFQPGAFGQDRAALAQLYMTRQMLVGQFEAIVNIANNAQTYGTKSTDAKLTLPKVENLIGEFTAAIMMFERSLDTSPSDQASIASDQVQTEVNVTPGGSLTGDADRVTTEGPT